MRDRRQSSLSDAEFYRAAERELAAFYQAVLRTHGPVEAQRAAEQWIAELESPEAKLHSAPRHATISAAHTLALHVAH